MINVVCSCPVSTAPLVKASYQSLVEKIDQCGLLQQIHLATCMLSIQQSVLLHVILSASINLFLFVVHLCSALIFNPQAQKDAQT